MSLERLRGRFTFGAWLCGAWDGSKRAVQPLLEKPGREVLDVLDPRWVRARGPGGEHKESSSVGRSVFYRFVV